MTTKTNNATKTNKTIETMFTLKSVNDVMVKSNIIPKYTDSQNYVGCGTKSNTFSVNVKKSQFNIYCDNASFNAVKTVKTNDCEYIENGNVSDKLRNNKIIVKSIESLQKLVEKLASEKLAKLIVNE